MKYLTLIRHAKSSWDYPQLADFDRPLNSRGERSAPEMGRRLAARHIVPDLIVSSPANRAITTAEIIASEIGYPKDRIKEENRIYEASSKSILEVINEQNDSADKIFMFGHNPGMHQLAEFLADFNMYKFPTCAVLHIRFNTDSWKNIGKDKGIVEFYDFPKKKS